MPANGPHPNPLPKGEGTLSAESLSFHPLAVGELVLVNDDRRILAVRQDTGKPAWGKTAAIYQAELAGVAGPPTILPDALGSPQFTMTVFQGRLFARMGTALTGQPQDAAAVIRPGYLVCLDLAAQGRLLWKIAPEEGWAFEGSPLADERGRLRRHAAAGHPAADGSGLFRGRHGPAPLAAIHLRRRDALPRRLARVHPQSADARGRRALLQYESRRGGGRAR